MDHAEVRERLEIAAAEPGGLDRLIAGDTADASAVAAHLVGCDPCREEFGRLRRASELLRASIGTMAPPDLKARTLAFVAAVGRERGQSVAMTMPAPVVVGTMPDVRRLGVPRSWRWVAAAAALVVAIGATAFVVATPRDAQLAAAEDQVAGLSRVSATTVGIETQPDATRVPLAGTSDPNVGGALLFSPSSRQLVIIATDLAQPPSGKEYRCWLEVGGNRERIGRMFFAGDVAYWAGAVESLPNARAGTLFGVSLVDIVGNSVAGDPVLSGQL